MNKIRARLYGTAERMGTIVEFQIVTELPEEGERVHYSDPGWIWGKSKEARLDPEQRTGDDHLHTHYDFYEAEELDEDGNYSETHYLAIKRTRTFYVYIDGTHTDTIEELKDYTADDYKSDYNANWSGQPEELTDETIELVEQPE